MSLKDRFQKIASEISARHDYMRGDKGALEQKYQQLKQNKPNDNFGKVTRAIGLGTIDLAWFLFCLGKFGAKDLNTVFLDNQIIDKWKEKNTNIKTADTDSKVNAFFKNLQKSHPQTAARLKLWMLYTLFIGSAWIGLKVANNKDNVEDYFEQKKQEEEMQEAKRNTFAAYQEKLQPITPWLISQLIAAEGVHMENGLHTPYKDGNGIWTIGFGSTRLKDGSPVTAKTPAITTEEAYDLARWHLEEHETFFDLYCYSVADKNLAVRNTGEAFGLASIVYNSGTKFIEDKNDQNHRTRFELLRQEYKKYGAAIPDSIIADLFAKYPITNKAAFGKSWIDSHNPQDMADAIGLYMADGAGMHWRRWLEAGLITGDINPQDLLECPIKGMYDFYIYIGGGSGKKQKGKFALWEQTPNGLTPKKSTYKVFKEWLKNPQQLNPKTGVLTPITRQKVKDFLPVDILNECQHGKCEIGVISKKKEKTEKIEKQTYIIGYEDFYNAAMNEYAKGNYDNAANILEGLVTGNPNNALLHNDLALVYNKMGEYDKAIQQVKIILLQIGDKSQYGAAQYNAGVAYENKGDIEKALKNYKLSMANGNTAARKAVNRINKTLQKQKKSKKVAFYDGVQKIQVKQKYKNNLNKFSNNKDYLA